MIVIYFSIWHTNFIHLKGLFINQVFTSQGLLELWCRVHLFSFNRIIFISGIYLSGLHYAGEANITYKADTCF